MSDVPEEIVDYVRSTLDAGFEPHLIKEQLFAHGYEQRIVDAAFREAKKTPSNSRELSLSLVKLRQRFRNIETLFGMVYFFCFIVFLFVVAALSGANMFNVFVGFLPTMIAIVASVAIFDMIDGNKKPLLLAVPLVLCGLFYILGTTGTHVVFTKIDVPNITALNFIISFLFIIVSLFLGEVEHRVFEEQEEQELDEELEDVDEKLGVDSPQDEFKMDHGLREADQKDIDEYIQSIEDKAKALNSVIGRVYAKRRGGTEEVRDAVRIPKEWYNEFAQLENLDPATKVKKVRHLVNLVYERLMLWGQPENVVFGYRHKYLKSLNRDPEGNTPIVDVLATNDRDPVEVYYKSAIDFCEKILAELSEYDLENIGVR